MTVILNGASSKAHVLVSATYICNPEGKGLDVLKNGLAGDDRVFDGFKADIK